MPDASPRDSTPFRAMRTNTLGNTPITTQAPASTSMGTSIAGPFSFTFSAAGVRGSPWKTTPTTFVKQARARPPITARLTMARRLSTKAVLFSATPWNPPRYIKNSLTNPLKGGSPEMAREPMRKVTPVIFMLFKSPPRASMERVPVFRITTPAPMKRSDLKIA